VLEIHSEDNNAVNAFIRANLGETVLLIVTETARITNLKIKNKSLQQAESIRKMLFAMVDDIRVILVKLADRLDRMRNISSMELEEQKLIAQEVIDIWAPLAGRLGMSTVKSELEDLSLKFLHPDAYAQIKKIVALKKNERAQYLVKAEKSINEEAQKSGIPIQISSRAKHFYSIYQKMRKRNKSIDDLYDLLAIRIICDSAPECYAIVGLVHGIWKPLEGRFKDYIAVPKANGYQSLHTSVLCEGMPLEIQVRSQSMHAVAEFGVASHWLYKKGKSRDSVEVKNLSIINKLRELKNEHLQDEHFFNEIRGELLGDSIFVFTPQSDVIELPSESTAIDFAYAIHSQIGEKIVGAKANGQIIPLSRALSNTQIIEILTHPNAHPTVNQLNMVKTAKARSKIKAWLLQNGQIEEKPEVQKTDAVKDELTAKTVKPPRHKHKKGDSLLSEDQPVATGKIRVGDTTNFMVTKAKCCNPEFGDAIVGFVSRGRGIIVHRADCRTFLRIPHNEERTLSVAWDTN
jgi:GTP pyrophosphokinase